MTTSDRYPVVAVPFPFVERDAARRRPALLIASPQIVPHDLCWVLMITSAANETWPDDIPITDLALAGLPRPSVIRPAKIATVERARATNIGSIDATTAAAVQVYLSTLLNLPSTH